MKGKNSRKFADHEDQEVKDLASDLDTVLALEAVAKSEGGKVLLEGLKEDLLSAIEKIASEFKTLKFEDYIALGAEISNKLEVIKAITQAKDNRYALQDQLAELLKTEE